MVVDQEELYKNIDNFTQSTLPHSIMLIGEVGSGKKEICEYIANKFDLQLFDITSTINNEFISQINQSQIRSLYVVDVKDISIKDQNILLKLYEEPNNNTYIILKSVSEYFPLETILSRSYILKMKSFSKEMLSQYITSNDREYVLKICTTPGQVEIANHTDMNKLRDLCKNMINKIDEAPLFNVMSIVNKINFDDEYDKFDLFLFIKVLSYECLISDKKCLDLYLLIKKLNTYIWSMANKKQYFEHFLINAWK